MPGDVPRAELIARRKQVTVGIELETPVFRLLCRALREVTAEYSDEPSGINAFLGGGEYGAGLADLKRVSERLDGIRLQAIG